MSSGLSFWKICRKLTFFFILYVSFIPSAFCQDTLTKTLPGDSNHAAVHPDTLRVSPSAISSEVKYSARDSIVFDLENKMAYLYGNTKLSYQDITLEAGFTTINFGSNEICAEGIKDSSGKMVGLPIFKEK